MNNVKAFPHSPHLHPDHESEDQGTETPDPEKLQRLLGDLIESTFAFQRPLRDREVRIRNFRSDRFQLIDDLVVSLEERGSQYIANSYDTGQYSIGYSPEDAIYNLCSVIEDYYDLLNEDEECLSPPLNSHLQYLRSILQERE